MERAKALQLRQQQQQGQNQQVDLFPDPTLRPEDLLLHIELECCGAKGVWVKSLEGCLDDEILFRQPRRNVWHGFTGILHETPKVVFQFTRQQVGEVSVDPFYRGNHNNEQWKHLLWHNMNMEISTWRMDTGKMIYFGYTEGLSDCAYDEEADAEDLEGYRILPGIPHRRRMKPNNGDGGCRRATLV